MHCKHLMDRIGLGSWAFGEDFYPSQSRSDSIKTLHYGIREGITHFDTAQGYGKGRAEQIVGQQLKRLGYHQDSSITVATKLFLPPSVKDLRNHISKSLHRLCKIPIHVLYIHWPDHQKEIGPYLEELYALQQEGLFRHLGLSNFPPSLLKSALAIAPISYCQFPCSLLWIRSYASLSSLCKEHSITTVGYSPLCMGLLTGAYREASDFSPFDRRATFFPFMAPYKTLYHALCDLLKEKATQLDTSCASIALRWAFSRSLDILLLGARTRKHLEEDLASLSLPLPSQVESELSSLSEEIDRAIPSNEDNPFFHRW